MPKECGGSAGGMQGEVQWDVLVGLVQRGEGDAWGMQGGTGGEDMGSANAFQGDRGGGELRLAAQGDAGATWGMEPGNAWWAG